MKSDRYILFYGELPPNAVHGIACANKVNLEILKSSFQIDIIEEDTKLSEHGKRTLNKLVSLIKNEIKIVLKSIINKYDYFYLNFALTTFGCFKTFWAILNFRLFNRGKVILHIHRGDFFSRFYTTFVNRSFTRLIFRLSSTIIVLSDKQKIDFEKIFRGNFHVLNNTVEFEFENGHVNFGRSNFIYISNYLTDKGIIDLLDVFQDLTYRNKSIVLHTYGAFSDQNLKEIILKYNSANIFIHNAIVGEEKFSVIAEADCLILPSWNEGQPIVLLEAMSVGTPIIATEVGLIPEMLGYDYPYLTIPQDKVSLEKIILNYIDDNNLFDLSNKLKARYDKLYSKKIHTNSLIEIFC